MEWVRKESSEIVKYKRIWGFWFGLSGTVATRIKTPSQKLVRQRKKSKTFWLPLSMHVLVLAHKKRGAARRYQSRDGDLQSCLMHAD